MNRGKRSGHYLGTEIAEKWWKRFRKDKFFARGNGEFWTEDLGLYFLRYLTKEPLFIPYASILEIKSGKWHAGKWMGGAEVVKIIWDKDGQRLSSGFLVARGKEETAQIKASLEEQVLSWRNSS